MTLLVEQSNQSHRSRGRAGGWAGKGKAVASRWCPQQSAECIAPCLLEAAAFVHSCLHEL